MRILLLLFILSSSFGCKTKEASTKAQETSPAIPSVQVDRNYMPNREGAKYDVESWSVEGDILTVGIAYSGCKGSTFTAHFSGAWMKSLPPKGRIMIERHPAENDACREIQKETVQFDLKTMRYDGQSKVMVLSSVGKHSAEYSY